MKPVINGFNEPSLNCVGWGTPGQGVGDTPTTKPKALAFLS